MSRLGFWSGMLGAPLAWFLTLEAGYALTPWACTRGHVGALHVVTVVGIALALLAGVPSLRSSLLLARRADDGPGIPRQRFMAAVGVATSVLFLLVIIATEIPVLVFRACE